MRIIFCGGGTAGHLTPAIAIAEEIKKEYQDCEILFIGRSGGEENALITKGGYALETIEINGIKRKITLENIKTLITAVKGIKEAKKIIKKYKPDAVVGTGGYVCWPVLKSACQMKIPTVIHESNACPGLVTKLLYKKCDRVLLNFPGSEVYFKKKDNLSIVGNPVRSDFTAISKASARSALGIRTDEILIASFGGSGGSKVINDIVISVMEEYSSKSKNIKHIHSCGRKYYQGIKKSHPKYTEGYDGCQIKAYIEDMPRLILAADIIISRCGAMTLSEIAAASAAAILIPSPNVTNNHQYKNAELLTRDGAAILIEEKDLTTDTLLKSLAYLKNNREQRKIMGKRLHSHFTPDAKKKIAKEIKDLVV